MTETVFISGAGKGLGLALTGRFLQAGFHVFAGIHHPSPDLSGLLRGFPKMLTVLPLDVADMESICQSARQVAEQVSALDVLINNAAIYMENKQTPLEDLDLTGLYLEKTMTVNAFGPLRVTQQFLPLLRAGRRKLIINISSESGSLADCGRCREFAYCMSKAALNMESKLLQNYLGEQGFKVLAVHPGWVRTAMGGPEADIDPDEAADGIFSLAAKERLPGDVIYLDYQGNPLPW